MTTYRIPIYQPDLRGSEERYVQQVPQHLLDLFARPLRR